MASITAKDYEALGAANAVKVKLNGVDFESHDYDRESKSWQSRAYWKGFDAEMKRYVDLSQDPVSMEEAREHFPKWPPAAAEHFRLLTNDITTCKSQARRERLLKACDRMIKRHAAGVC